MELSENFDYESVEEVLAEAEVESCASELQGMLCGMVTAGLKVEDAGWIDVIQEMIVESADMVSDVISPEIREVINNLANWTYAEINQQDSLAPMLLPDDNYPALDQLEAIILWCQGFLLGFGIQMGDSPIENDDIKEALTDLADISQLALEVEDDEESQNALLTVTEHVKVAVQVIHWEVVVKAQASVVDNTPKNETVH